MTHHVSTQAPSLFHLESEEYPDAWGVKELLRLPEFEEPLKEPRRGVRSEKGFDGVKQEDDKENFKTEPRAPLGAFSGRNLVKSSVCLQMSAATAIHPPSAPEISLPPAVRHL